MKKAIISLIIILLFAGTIFYFGWVQFAVPTGHCGVLISKTSGVNPKPIISGKFAWCWERLLPTNTELLIFNLEPVNYTETISATLPSGGTYSSILQSTPDFSYSVSLKTTAKIRPDYIVQLVKQNDIRTQEDLDEVTKSLIRQFDAAAVEFILKNAQNTSDTLSIKPVSTDEILAGTKAAENFPELEIISVEVFNVKIPDMTLYNFAKDLYLKTQADKENISAKESTIKIDAEVKSNQLGALIELGEIFTKYPILVEYLKEKELSSILELINAE